MIGLALNGITLVLTLVIVLIYRFIDRNNRQLDKLKRYASSVQNEIDEHVKKSVQELHNTALELDINTKAGRELLNDVNQEDSRLSEIQERIEGLEKSVQNSETAMDQLASLTQSVEENMRNLRQESDFLTAVSKKVKEVDERSQKVTQSMNEMLVDFETKANASLERISDEIRSDFEAEKNDCIRIIEDTKESAESNMVSYVDNEKETLSQAIEEIQELIDSIRSRGHQVVEETLSELTASTGQITADFRNHCEQIVQTEEERMTNVRGSLNNILEDLSTQVDTVKFAHRESMEQIQKEKSQMEEVFIQLQQKGAELVDKTVSQMKEDSRRTVSTFRGECESLQRENVDHSQQLKLSFQEALSSVAAQLDSIKQTHETSMAQLKDEKTQMLALVAQQRTRLEELIKKEISSVLSGVKEKTDTYTAIFDAKVSDVKSRMEKDFSILRDKQKRDQAAFLSQIDGSGQALEKRLEKFKNQAEDVETRYQRNIQLAVDRSLALGDDIFENLRRDIEARAGKSEKDMEAYMASIFKKIEDANSEILHHFGEMRAEVELKKEESKNELMQLKNTISNALHEANSTNGEKLTQMLTETESSRQRLREDFDNFIQQISSDMDSFEKRISDELTRSENQLTENTEKLNHISAEIDTSGAQMVENAHKRFQQTIGSLEQDVEGRINSLNRLFEDHKTHFDYKISQIDSVEADLTRYVGEINEALEKRKVQTDEVLEIFSQEVDKKRQAEWEKTEEGYARIHNTLEGICKEIEALKASSYENTNKQLSIYEDQFFSDLRERTDSLNLKVLEFQQQTEKDIEKILQESREHQNEIEEQRRQAIAEGMKKIEDQTDQEFSHLSNRIQALQEKISSDALHNEKEINDFKILIRKNIEGIQSEAQNAFEVEFSKYDMSISSRLNEYQKVLDEQIEGTKNKLDENIFDLRKRFETSYSDLKVMHSNVIQQMKNTEADLKNKYADLKTSVSENVNIIKDTFIAQKDGVIEEGKRATEELSRAILIVGQDVEKMKSEVRQESEKSLNELSKKYEEFYAEFNYKTDTLLNDLDYKSRDFRQSSADTREKIEAVQQKLHNDVEESRKNLSFRLDEITKRIRDFETQTKLFERADSMKKKLTEDIASLRNEIDQLVIKKKEFKDIDLTLAKVKTIEADITGKLGQLQANKRTVDDLEKDFKRLRDISVEINSRIDKVTSSNDVVMEMQARLRQLDELEKVVEEQYSRLQKKEHVLNHTTMGIDKNFEEMQELETKIKTFESSFTEFLSKLAMAGKRIDQLSANKERAEFAVEKLLDLDSLLSEIDTKIDSTMKARQWLADTETRLKQLHESSLQNLELLKAVSTEARPEKLKDQTDLIIRLANQGWNASDIAKKLNMGLGEVQLAIEVNLDK